MTAVGWQKERKATVPAAVQNIFGTTGDPGVDVLLEPNLPLRGGYCGVVEFFTTPHCYQLCSGHEDSAIIPPSESHMRAQYITKMLAAEYRQPCSLETFSSTQRKD